MGVNLDLSNMELLTYDMDNWVLQNADDASAISFCSTLVAGQTLNNNQMDTEVAGAGQATVTPDQGVTSGEDSN
jgi:hypothetical protein